MEKWMDEILTKLEMPDDLAARVLLASVRVGPNIERVSSFLREPVENIKPIAKNYRKNRIWLGAKVNESPWYEDPAGDVNFILDTMVGRGEYTRADGEYKITKLGRAHLRRIDKRRAKEAIFRKPLVAKANTNSLFLKRWQIDELRIAAGLGKKETTIKEAKAFLDYIEHKTKLILKEPS